jgi:class 3 adenylate cyclase
VSAAASPTVLDEPLPKLIFPLMPILSRLSLTTRNKLLMVALAMAIFAALGTVTTKAVGRPVEIGVTNAILIGMGVGLFEEFYVQTRRGTWLRNMHPLRSILVYTGIVCLLYLVSVHIAHLLLWRLDDLPTVYRRLPYGLAFFTAFSIIGILMIRVVHFIGLGTLFHLLIGTYHRPVLETQLLLFLDVNGSTALSERLGPFKTRALMGKFLFDVAQPITDHGGDIYLYKGDGLIALWPFGKAVRGDAILRAIDDMFAAIEREAPAYRESFGLVPSFRVGVHGGEVVVSEQGDAKRSIGIYGDTINIAARMEEAARHHGVACIISDPVAKAVADRAALRPVGEERVRGISTPLTVYEYRPPSWRGANPPSEAAEGLPGAPLASVTQR